MTDSVEYGGTDVLEFMAAAKNYNEFLVNEVLQHADGVHQAVDFGAGIGTFAKMVRDKGIEVVCVEPDGSQLARLREDGFTAFPGLSSIPGGSVSYLYSLNVLEHIEDDTNALREMFHALRPGGRCFVYVPAFQILYSSFDRRIGHFRRYRRGQLAGLFRACGFADINASYRDSLGFPAALAFRLVGPSDGSVNEFAISCYDKYLLGVSLRLDNVLKWICGKNVMIHARKPA